MSTPIAEDFAAIRARLEAIQAAERPVAVPEADAPPQASPAPSGAADFYGWLMGGGLWALG
ncbi:hypothetical protein [Roseicella aerolata]|uniref:Uncharacterized protein n=1 Tax=Roseicella aerolata TaxID=2883479 RepID=A0A9X1IJW3_9PROT|nr:hypothetical protein [Roseicella aerolata]MCB4824728.1 hypothetical protein [Roseicella aerolata]